jgi:hypothetical protein
MIYDVTLRVAPETAVQTRAQMPQAFQTMATSVSDLLRMKTAMSQRSVDQNTDTINKLHQSTICSQFKTCIIRKYRTTHPQPQLINLRCYINSAD